MRDALAAPVPGETQMTDNNAVKMYEDHKATMIAEYRNTPSNQTSKLEALRLKIELVNSQIENIRAFQSAR
jgi:hypothetical protein